MASTFNLILTQDDLLDLENGYSIQTLTAEDIEIKVFPPEYSGKGMAEDI